MKRSTTDGGQQLHVGYGGRVMTETRDNLQPCQGVSADVEQLQALVAMRMPFGKYQGRLLIDLPEPYLVWFSQQGFPAGKLGTMLETVYTIKVNGLEYLFEPLRS